MADGATAISLESPLQKEELAHQRQKQLSFSPSLVNAIDMGRQKPVLTKLLTVIAVPRTRVGVLPSLPSSLHAISLKKKDSNSQSYCFQIQRELHM